MKSFRLALHLPLVAAFIVTVPARAEDGAAVAELHEAIKPTPRDGRWGERHKQINARIAKGNVDLVFIGDSITQGWEGKGRAVWQEFYGERNAANLGIGGDRTQHVLWRLENGNIDGVSPKLAVVMIGTNNSSRNPAEQTIEGVEAIVASLRERLPKTKILLMAVFPRGPNAEDPKRLENDKVNRAIAKHDDGEMVRFLDIKDAFLEKDGTLTREIMPDLLHLSEDGYRRWAEAIEPSLKRLMQE
ncbi:MAG: GDSL family lipase [Planctomycetales bacterium]|nr:GDSL family lipase [Planctomycetales bacterium]